MKRIDYQRSYQTRRLRLLADGVVGHTVLDIGHAVMHNPFLLQYHCVGYDLNKSFDGQQHYAQEIQGDVKDIRNVLGGQTFDSIVCGELIEHLENPYEFLRDLHGLLADDGRLILSTPNPLGFPVGICELFRIKRFFFTEWHTYYFLPRWVERILNKTGYELCAIKPVGLFLPFLVVPYCPITLSYQVVYVARKAHPAR